MESDLIKPGEFAKGQPSSRNTLRVAVSGVLWLVSVILAAVCPFALRDVLVWAMALLIPQPDQYTRLRTAQTINVTSQCGIVIFGILAIIVMVFSTEYFFHAAGQPRLLRRLGGIIIVECVIVIPVAWFFWRG